MPAQNLTDNIKKRATWSVIMGVLTAAFGLFLIAYPLATGAITALLLGWVLIFVCCRGPRQGSKKSSLVSPSSFALEK